MTDELLTVNQVSERLKVHANTVRRWILEKKLPGVKMGGNKAGWRVSESGLLRFIEEAREKAS